MLFPERMFVSVWSKIILMLQERRENDLFCFVHSPQPNRVSQNWWMKFMEQFFFLSSQKPKRKKMLCCGIISSLKQRHGLLAPMMATEKRSTLRLCALRMTHSPDQLWPTNQSIQLTSQGALSPSLKARAKVYPLLNLEPHFQPQNKINHSMGREREASPTLCVQAGRSSVIISLVKLTGYGSGSVSKFCTFFVCVAL